MNLDLLNVLHSPQVIGADDIGHGLSIVSGFFTDLVVTYKEILDLRDLTTYIILI